MNKKSSYAIILAVAITATWLVALAQTTGLAYGQEKDAGSDQEKQELTREEIELLMRDGKGTPDGGSPPPPPPPPPPPQQQPCPSSCHEPKT